MPPRESGDRGGDVPSDREQPWHIPHRLASWRYRLLREFSGIGSVGSAIAREAQTVWAEPCPFADDFIRAAR